MKIPDVEELKGREFVFTEDFLKTGSNTTFPKGVRFVIKSVKKGWVTFKVKSPLEDCMPGIQRFADSLVKSYTQDLKLCRRNIKLWEKDPSAFTEIPEENVFHNSMKHPLTLFGDGVKEVYSRSYERSDGLLNDRFNVWYNKEFYETQLECLLWNVKKYSELSNATIQKMYDTYYRTHIGGNHNFDLKVLNKAKFKPVASKKQKAE